MKKIFLLTLMVFITGCGIDDGPSLLQSPNSAGGNGGGGGGSCPTPMWSMTVVMDNPNGFGNHYVSCSSGCDQRINVRASGTYSKSCPIGDNVEYSHDLTGGPQFWLRLNGVNVPGWADVPADQTPSLLSLSEAEASGDQLDIAVYIPGFL